MKINSFGVLLKEKDIKDPEEYIKDNFSGGQLNCFEIEIKNLKNKRSLILQKNSNQKYQVLKKMILDSIDEWYNDCHENPDVIRMFCS